MYKYISNQDVILECIADNLCSNSKLTIVKGASGTGKSFLLSCIKTKTEKGIIVYKLEGDYYLHSRDYYPFLKFINTMYLNDNNSVKKKLIKDGIENTGKELGSWAPLGNDFLSACITELSAINKKKRELYNFIFDKDELDILFPLEYFCNRERNIIFLIDDLQYWDTKSLRFLYTLIQQQDSAYTFLKNVQFVGAVNTDYFNCDEELNGIIKLAGKQVYELEVIRKGNYKIVLKQLGLNIALNEGLIEALYSVTGGNVSVGRN